MNVSAQLFSIYLHDVKLVDLLGYIAAACTTFAFIPQIAKIRKQGGKDVSYWMLGIYLAGLVLWLLFGMILHSAPIIVANVVSIFLAVSAIVLKAVTRSSRVID